MGDIVEYFISATNADNKTETSPMTAPLGFFSYTIK
jgi:hypothetical protein